MSGSATYPASPSAHPFPDPEKPLADALALQLQLLSLGLVAQLVRARA